MLNWLRKKKILKPKPITPEERKAKGWKRCSYCSGHGVYHNGYVRLGCHRCIDGLTTKEREHTAQDWEMHCALFRYDPNRSPEKEAERQTKHKEIMARYDAARERDWDHEYFRS